MATSRDIFKDFLVALDQASAYSSWLRDNCGKTHGGSAASPIAGTPAALWYTWRDRVLAGTAKPEDAPSMGDNHLGVALVKAGLMPLYPADVINPAPPPPPPSSSLYFGALLDGQFYVNEGLTTNSSDGPWSANIAGGAWDQFEISAGKKISMLHWGGPGAFLPGTNPGSDPAQFSGALAVTVRNRGAIPLYTIAASLQQMTDLWNNSNVNGTLTAVDNFANAVKAGNVPILARPFWEMQANWGQGWAWQENPGGGLPSGTTRANYQLAWRTLVNRVRAICGPLVQFVWCPNIVGGGIVDPSPWFPGLGYVDWMGFDGYINQSVYATPGQLFDPTMAILSALAPNLPVIICETGAQTPTPTPGKGAWLTDLYTTFAPKNPTLKSIIQFNLIDGTKNWPVELGDAAGELRGTATAKYKAAVGTSRYIAGGAANQANMPLGGKVVIPS